MGFQRAPRSCATPLNECPLDGGMPRPNGPKMGFYHGFNDSKGFLSEDLSEHGIEQVVNSLDWFRSPYVENTEDLTELSLYLRDAGGADFYMSVSGSLVGGNAIPCYNGAWLGEPLKTEAEISLLFVLFCRGDDRWITEFGFDDLVGVPMQSGPDLTTREYNPIEPGVLQQLMHAKGEKFVIPGEGSENHEEYYCKHGCGFKSDYRSVSDHENYCKKGPRRPNDMATPSKGPGRFLTDDELSQLTASQLEGYIKEKQDWLKEDIRKTLTPSFFRSPVGDRQCEVDNCNKSEFRRTGYCLDHRNTEFFDKFEVKEPSFGKTALIVKKVRESNSSKAPLAGAAVFVGLTVYETVISMLPDRLELVWRGVTRGVFVGIIFWLLFINLGSAEVDENAGGYGAAWGNLGNMIFTVCSFIVIAPLAGSIGALLGHYRYQSEEKKYVEEITVEIRDSQ